MKIITIKEFSDRWEYLHKTTITNKVAKIELLLHPPKWFSLTNTQGGGKQPCIYVDTETLQNIQSAMAIAISDYKQFLINNNLTSLFKQK